MSEELPDIDFQTALEIEKTMLSQSDSHKNLK